MVMHCNFVMKFNSIKQLIFILNSLNELICFVLSLNLSKHHTRITLYLIYNAMQWCFILFSWFILRLWISTKVPFNTWICKICKTYRKHFFLNPVPNKPLNWKFRYMLPRINWCKNYEEDKISQEKSYISSCAA